MLKSSVNLRAVSKRRSGTQRDISIHRVALAGVFALMLPTSLFADTLSVPNDFPDITSAAIAAEPGDSILVWPSPGGDWTGQLINLRQGVTLRGMVSFEQMGLMDSEVNLLNEPLGVMDTTRVEHFSIYDPPAHETVHIFTPRSRIDGCSVFTSGPESMPAIRCLNGGTITRCEFTGGGDNVAVVVEQGDVIIAWSVFAGLLIDCEIANNGAGQPAFVSMRNNTIKHGWWVIALRPDSYAELTNNIFEQAEIFCGAEGTIEIEYNDFWLSSVHNCPPGPGNIAEDPQYCEPSSWLLHPDSPCVGSGEGGATMGAFGVGCGAVSVEEGIQADNWGHNRVLLTPNPSSAGQRQVRFELPKSAHVTLHLFDVGGRLVETFVDREFSAGKHNLDVTLADPCSGSYYYELRVDGSRRVGKLVVVK